MPLTIVWESLGTMTVGLRTTLELVFQGSVVYSTDGIWKHTHVRGRGISHWGLGSFEDASTTAPRLPDRSCLRCHNTDYLIEKCVRCFVLLTWGWGRLETRPPVVLGSYAEPFSFTMSLFISLKFDRQIKGNDGWQNNWGRMSLSLSLPLSPSPLS